MITSMNEHLREIIRLQEDRLASEMIKMKEERYIQRKRKEQGIELSRLCLMLPLYCQPMSSYYHDDALLGFMEETAEAFLATQLPSGFVSLYSCNIDSPPDTAFTVHLASNVIQLAMKEARHNAGSVIHNLNQFLERAASALLTGGIHTPNHRWVMASALAKMEQLYGGDAYRARAFEFLNEGLDITEYGEWTERSNSLYNAICAYYLHTVGTVFNYQPAMAAASSTLRMMQYLMHPGDTIATEYSGRQDLGQLAYLDDRFYIAYHLFASHDQDPILAEMARVAARTGPLGSSVLLYWMLEPERMKLPEETAELSSNYTILFGEHNRVRVPDRVPYLGPVMKHPHGAAVLRHRRGKLSITVMAGQSACIYVQYGNARMYGMKLGVGWFGIGAAAFPSIIKQSDNQYRLELELEACYYGPLSEELSKPANGSYVDMPNHLREKTSELKLTVALELILLDDGMDIRVVSDDPREIFLQLICMFDKAGTLSGEGLEQTGEYSKRLSYGDTLYRVGEDCIHIDGGCYEHDEVSMRNDGMNSDAINMMINWVTPTDAILKVRCYTQPIE